MLERHSVTEALRSEDGRVTGVRAALLDDAGRKTGETRDFTADVVLAADGNSTRTAVSLGISKRDDRPLGVAVRTYFTSPRHEDDWMEGWLELPGRDGKLLPGYGWVFGVGDGTSNVGLGILNSSKDFGKLDYKQVLREWTAGMPADWGFTPDNQVGEIRGAALPMGFNRTPHYSPGLLLLGDAGGMVSPFNGEGISYAMESARFAAEFIADAASRSASVQIRPLVQITGEAEFNELFLEGARIPHENIVGGEGNGWAVAITTLMHERATLAFGLQIQVKIALRQLMEKARSTRADGRMASEDAIVRQRLAQLYIESEVLRLNAYRGLSAIMRNGVPGPEGSLGKWQWAEVNQALTELALDIAGPRAQLAEDEWTYRFLRARANSIEGGTTEILKNIVAERVLGLPRLR